MSHFSNQDLKPGLVIAKAKEAFIVQYPRPNNDDPVIRTSEG